VIGRYKMLDLDQRATCMSHVKTQFPYLDQIRALKIIYVYYQIKPTHHSSSAASSPFIVPVLLASKRDLKMVFFVCEGCNEVLTVLCLDGAKILR
jgi:hypothetical protein